MQLLNSFAILLTLTYTTYATYFGNGTITDRNGVAAAAAAATATTTLAPSYTVQPITTVITYADPSTTFYVTQTLFTTIYPTTDIPSSPITIGSPDNDVGEVIDTTTSSTKNTVASTTSTPTITTTPDASQSTVTSEFVTTYSDESTTYTSTITSTLVVYATQKIQEKQVKDLASDEITTTYTTTIGITLPASVAETATPIHPQCQDVTHFVTVTETVGQVTITETPAIQYVTVTMAQTSRNDTVSNSTLYN